MHPKLRPWVGAIALSLSLIPAGTEFYFKQQAIAEEKTAQEQAERAIAASEKQLSRDEGIALARARRCRLIDENYPLVEGGNVYYDVKKRDRVLPANTPLCSAKSGVTAIVDEAGTVTSIKMAAPEKLHEVLKNRGLVK